MSKMAKPVKPDDITTLKLWATRWGKPSNLGFDPESREPTVYAADGARVKSFPWERAGDVITILTDPSRFGATAVGAAQTQYDRFRSDQAQRVTQFDPLMAEAQAELLNAWRSYNSVPPEGRASLRPRILAAENRIRRVEESLARYKYVERRLRKLGDDSYGAHVPPIPMARRTLTVRAASEGEASSESQASA
jgi:hypothetical protein